MSSVPTLNLARKWRSQQFATIIGQDLAVRMLKNGLYRGLFFPVYLLSGQRGCGKTSTARVFASAINCEQLPTFQQSPKTQELPCGQCSSCLAMQTGSHPDFIEIDAASHTGVDHVRQIIEAASLLPILGRKKIYLIDEAHMLSKAAFNALLKILEEPPASVLFMLATTDQEKIIETVRSRCFQLFFTPVAPNELSAHLRMICQQEEIAYEEEAFDLIVKESEGSVRDAINLLEQVRLATVQVTAESVRTVLGRMSEEHLMQLLHSVVQQNSAELLDTIAALNVASYAPEKIYYGLVELLRQVIWSSRSRNQQQNVKASLPRLLQVLECLYTYELPFVRTTKKHAMLEFMLLKCTMGADSGAQAPSTPTPTSTKATAKAPAPVIAQTATAAPDVPMVDALPAEQSISVSTLALPTDDLWQQFLVRTDELGDPLIRSIFNQAKFGGVNDVNTIELLFSEQSAFLVDWLKDTTKSWLPLIKEVFGEQVQLTSKLSATIEAPKVTVSAERSYTPTNAGRAVSNQSTEAKPPVRVPGGMPAKKWPAKKPTVAAEPVGKKIDVSDKEQWQKTNLVLSYFPGTVTQVEHV